MCQVWQFLAVGAQVVWQILARHLVVSHSDGATAKAVGPEALDRWRAVNLSVIRLEGDRRKSTYVLAMLSWVKRSQKPKIGLARTSRTA